MPAPRQQLYDSDVHVAGPSYFAEPPSQAFGSAEHQRSAMTLSMMQMQRRMRQQTRDAARHHQPQAQSQPQPQRFAADGDWQQTPGAPIQTPTLRRGSFSTDDPAQSPSTYRAGQPETSSGHPSPTPDGVVLPTLSAMLHNTWSPPQWQPTEQPDAGPAPGLSLPPTHRRKPSLSIATSPILPSSMSRNGSHSPWGTNGSIKSEATPLRQSFSPMQVTSPRSEFGDDPMASSPRGSCSSPSNYSTTSVPDESQQDEHGKPRSPVMKDRKASRYLREMDRRAILERLSRGEKQATLAKEYHVSRAAICNLFKHRHEVMARTDEDPFAKHPKKRKNKKALKNRRSRSLRLATASNPLGSESRAVVTPPSAPTSVTQLQSDSVLLLLTIMSDRRSSADEFRRASERVLWLLIEEALSVVPIKLAQVTISSEAKIMGVTTEHPACAISMEQYSSPMLEVFQLLEPERPYGRITVDSNKGCSLADSHLPPTLKYHNVFLFDVAVVSSETVRDMIECAKARGALEVMIYVVALFISSDVVETLQEAYPHVRIVTTQTESHILEAPKNRRSCVDVVLGRFDQVYQTRYTLV